MCGYGFFYGPLFQHFLFFPCVLFLPSPCVDYVMEINRSSLRLCVLFNSRAGRFGTVAPWSTEDCAGPCQAGYYCPEGSDSKRKFPCGGKYVYCPEGSGSPVAVPTGSYSTKEYVPVSDMYAYFTNPAESFVNGVWQDSCSTFHSCSSATPPTCSATPPASRAGS